VKNKKDLAISVGMISMGIAVMAVFAVILYGGNSKRLSLKAKTIKIENQSIMTRIAHCDEAQVLFDIYRKNQRSLTKNERAEILEKLEKCAPS